MGTSAAARAPSAGRLTGRSNTSSPARPKRPPPTDTTSVFGYSPPPEEPNLLSRDVWRWVQRLDLSTPIRSPRRDLCNGFLAAELLSRFHPGDIAMHSFQNGTSAAVRRDNWSQVCRVAAQHGLHLPPALVERTMAQAHGAAVALLELLYEGLTAKKLQRLDPTQQLAPGSSMAGCSPDAAAALAAAPVKAAEAAVSFGEPAAGAAADSGALRAIKAPGSSAPTLEFGAVQTQAAGTGADVRRRFAQGQQQQH